MGIHSHNPINMGDYGFLGNGQNHTFACIFRTWRGPLTDTGFTPSQSVKHLLAECILEVFYPEVRELGGMDSANTACTLRF